MRTLLIGLLTTAIACSAPAQVLINEVDCNQTGTDTREFVEIYDGGQGNSSLNNLTLVFYNGASNSVYAAYDLSAYFTNNEGFFVAGNEAVTPPPDLVIPNDSLQNGTDAVALYFAPASNFPFGQALTATGLIDALVYTTGQGQNLALEALLGAGQEQVDEAQNGNSDTESMQRCPDGSGGGRNTLTYTVATPTPGAPNACAAPFDIVINEVDSNDPDVDDAEFIELYDRGVGNTSLTGLVLVLYNGGDDGVYASYDLDGMTTDENGYFLLGSAGLSPDLVLNSAGLQNGPDAVALYAGDATDFPNGTLVTVNNLLAAFVYGSGAADTGLLPLLNADQPQVDENALSTSSFASMQRCPDGIGNPLETVGFVLGTPTPGAENDCPLAAPMADFSWTPTTVYAGQPVNFHDLSTGPPTSWTWTFTGAVFPSAFVQNPQGVEFAEAGLFDVQLSVNNTTGSSVTTRYITVLDPTPSATGILVSPTDLTVCQEATFVATGVLGRPPLTYAWDLVDGSDVSFFSGNGNPLNFVVPGTVPAGNYRARLSLINTADTTLVYSEAFGVAAPSGASVLVEIVGAAESNINNFPVSVLFSQPVSGFTIDDLLVTNGTAVAFTGSESNYGFELQALSEGIVTVQVVAGAGVDICELPNVESNIAVAHYDVTPPTAMLAPVLEGTNTIAPVQFLLSADEDLEAPAAGAFTTVNGAVTGVSASGAEITVDVEPAGNGQVTLTLPQGACSDLAGNPFAGILSASVLYVSESSIFHNADQDHDNRVSLSELLRLIQIYNVGSFHCQDGTEDGYNVGPGDTTCTPHASDYNPQDWKISLSELLRAIQFYNLNGYYRCEEDTEDGFCAGPQPI